jgi:DNA modification methylase
MYELIHNDNIKAMLVMQTNSVDLTITSPPYNLEDKQWDMGGNGRTKRNGIEYKAHDDAMSQADYESWQVNVLKAIYYVSKPGASLFYNHKTRTLDGALIHPMDWLRRSGWTIRQEIIWDRVSTHNHEPRLFWNVDERIYWLTKGKPTYTDVSIGLPSVWREFGPSVSAWHPAPFTIALPRMILKAINAKPGWTVLDPFAGSCTTIKAALEFGCNAIGIDVCKEYLDTARREIERQPKQITGSANDYADAPLFAQT